MVMNEVHTPNSSNVHTHGLHIDPNIDSVFVEIRPGDTYTYYYKIPDNHAPGLHWYHSHQHGSSQMTVMGGLWVCVVSHLFIHSFHFFSFICTRYDNNELNFLIVSIGCHHRRPNRLV
jgi:hypothetical protein